MLEQISRRGFMQGAAALGAALTVGLDVKGAFATGSNAINPFVRLASDGTVTVVVKHFEMGQGTTTGLSTLVAEELGVELSTIQAEYAPASSEYNNNVFDIQATVGSTAMANSYEQYRRAGAQAADLIKRAAAAQWSVDPNFLSIAGGVVSSSDGSRSAPLGEFVAEAITFQPTPADELVLKSPEDFTVIGSEDTRRLDTKAKTNGTAVYGIDVRLPNMIRAALARPPQWGGRVSSFDPAPALAVDGVLDVKEGPGWVAVYAETTWAAFQGRDALSVEWDLSQAETRSSEELMAYHVRMLDDEGIPARNDGDIEAALAEAEDTLSLEFQYPFLAHAALEPLNCTVQIDGDSVTIWDACQMPGVAKPQVAEALGIPEDNVTIHTYLAGGSFGRKGPVDSHYHIEAAFAARLFGEGRPVQLVYSREDDTKGGYYRPQYAHRIDVAFDADNNPVGWHHRLAGKPLLAGSPFSMFVNGELDISSVYGAHDIPYAIPNIRVDIRNTDYGVPVLPWRSVMHTHTAHSKEIVMDVLAERASQDPVEYRLGMLGEHPRQAEVLRRVADLSGWAGRSGNGVFKGVAAHKAMFSYVAQVVDVSVDADGAIKVERVYCTIDCGLAVNPDIVRMQIESGVGFALGAAMRNKITLDAGVVDQENFYDYEPMRIRDMPEIIVDIVPSAENPSGVGEPGVPPLAPALSNAIFAATGQRILTLPLTDANIRFA